MLYLAYQAQSDIMVPVRAWASMAMAAGGQAPLADNPVIRNLTAAYELIARAGLTHTRPPFAIESVNVGNREVEVREEAAAATPFGTLLHFKKDIATAQPRVLMVAPLSGHFATLLRATVRTMLPEHDVYITDWHNARDVPLTAGCFGFDEYIEHLIKFLEVMGPGTHVLAVSAAWRPRQSPIAEGRTGRPRCGLRSRAGGGRSCDRPQTLRPRGQAGECEPMTSSRACGHGSAAAA